VLLYALEGPEGVSLPAADVAGKPVDPREALARLEEAGLLGAPPAAELPGEAAGQVPVEGVLTFSRNKAALGGAVFATPALSPADASLLPRLAGLLTTGGGPSSAALAAFAGVPHVRAARAAWVPAGLEFDEPLLGKARRAAGLELRPVSGRRRRLLREGERVRLDPATGEWSALSPARAPGPSVPPR